MGARTWPRRTTTVPWSECPIVTCGVVDGLPAIPWGWAEPSLLATRRQLRGMGLRPGGWSPVAVLAFQHTTPGGRSVEYADLFLIARAVPKRIATAAQRTAIAKALAARRTCQLCGREQDYYLSTISRLCVRCEDVTGYWPRRAAEHGWGWAA